MNISLRIGEIALSELIGVGSIGEIWRGTHLAFHYSIALKMVTDDCADAAQKQHELKHEIALLKRLSHPGIVSVYDTQTLAKTPVLAMELGDSACDIPGCVTSWASLRALLFQVLQALHYLHAQDIIHCDLKPANILRFSHPTRPPTYKLIDLGIAQKKDAQKKDAQGNDAGLAPQRALRRTYRGSPAYSAPEQIRGDTAEFGPWTDLYALGCTAYELASGAPPFGDADFISLSQKHLNAPPPPLCTPFDVPAPFNDWLQCLMRKDTQARYLSAEHAMQALLAIPACSPPRWRASLS